jgi:type II secretory pathway component GspD/PulD (secretin)
MSYARQTAVAGAVFLGLALNLRAQDSSRDDAPPSQTASPSETTSKTARPGQRPNRLGPRGDAPTPPTARDDQNPPASENTAGRDAPQRHEPISPDARVIQFSFATQPWENVLEWIAELAGMSLQMEVKPTGTFNYINDPNKYTLGQAIDILNSQLISKGHILLRKGKYLKVLAFKDGVPPDLIRQIKLDDLHTCGDSEYVTVFLPLKNVSAKAAAEEVKGFASEVGGKIVAQESVNQLMITDLVANIRLMRDYLLQVDAAGDGIKSRYRVFPLKYASAARVEANLRELFGLPPRQTTDQSRSRSERGNEDPRERFRRMMEAGGGGFNPFAQMQMFPGGQPGGDARGGDWRGERGGDSRGGDRTSQESRTSNITMSVDEPHNQILVMAPPDKLAIVEEFIKQVDVPREGDSEWTPRKPQIPTVRVIRLSDGDAQSLVTALTQIYQNTPGVRFSADQSNNAVVVVATPDDQDAIKKLAEQFEEDERNSIVLPLTVLDATTVAELLGTVYSSGQTDWRGRATPRPGQPRVVADRNRNQIMVRGSKKQVDDIRDMLAALGEPQVTQWAGSEKLRVIPLNAASSKAIREMVEQIWPKVSPNNNPIRIIELGKKSDGEAAGLEDSDPTGTSAIPRRGDERRVPAIDANGDQTTPDRVRPNSAPSRTPGRTSLQQKSAFQFVSRTTEERPSDEQPSSDSAETVRKEASAQETGQDSSERGEGAPLVVSLGPDNLVVASDDPAAIQAFMNLINPLMRSPGTGGAEYNVFYLKAAEAIVLQQTLNDILGISSVSFFGNTNSQATPLVKIVPDTRTNALIVYGNSNDVNRIEQLIRVLDRDDAPSSGAVSAPRIVPLRAANATAVARVIRDVYASRITTGSGFPGGGPGGGQFGGGPFGNFAATSSNRSSRSGSGTLSVGVDEQSNSIVVSCSESLFQEIKRLVETLDIAATETQRTVQIVTVRNSTPTAVQDALNGLMGITRTTSRPGNDGSNRNFGGGFPQFGNGQPGMQFGGNFPGGGFQNMPFGGGQNFFNRGGFDGGRSFDGGRGGFDGGFRGGFDGGFRGGDRRP